MNQDVYKRQEYDDMPLFNSADAALLLIAATGKYLKYTNNYSFVEEKIFDKLKRIITAYTDGTDLDGNDIYSVSYTHLNNFYIKLRIPDLR